MATFGYMRACKEDPVLDRQRDALAAAGVPAPHLVAEHGRSVWLRPALDALLDRLVPGDTVVVWTLGRLGDDAAEVARVVQELDRHGLRLVVTGLGLDTAAPAGRLVLAVMAQLAPQDEAEGRRRDGAGAHGIGRAGRRSRPHRLTPEQAARARHMIREEKWSYAQVAATLGVSRSVAWRAVNRVPPPRPTAL